MPQSVPTINGVAGSNRNLPINTLVQLNNTNSGGETSYLWTITDQPAGATDTLSSTIIQNPTFTPRKEGSYRISLTVNGTLTSYVIAAVLQLKSLTRIPAAQETTEVDAVDGWATDVDAQSFYLLNAAADPGTIIGVAAGVGCDAGVVVSAVGSTTIKTGLPGEETLLTYNVTVLPDATAYAAQLREPLYLSLGGVDGDLTPASGALIRLRLFGMYAAALGAVGDQVWVDRNGALTAPDPDRVPRRVALQVSATQIYFDGRYVSNAALDLVETLLADVGVSPALTTRLVTRGGKLQASEAGAAYVNVLAAATGNAPVDAPYLTNGANATLTNELNIQALAAALNFIASASGGKVTVRRLDNADLGAKFEIQSQVGVALLTLNGDGSAVFQSSVQVGNGITVDGASIFNDGVTFNDEVSLSTASVKAGSSAGFARLGGVLTESITAVGNINAGEDNLITYALPAALLSVDKDSLEIEAYGIFAANGNNKKVKLYFGATVIFATNAAAFNGTKWYLKARIVRTAAATQNAVVMFAGDTVLQTETSDFTTPAETLSGAITVKCTGEAVATDDIIQKGLHIAWAPANT